VPPWLGIVIAIVSAIVFPAIGLAVSWGALGVRIRNLEKLPERLDSLAGDVKRIDDRTSDSARSQGERIAQAQKDVDKLSGKVEGLDRGFALASRQRSRTAAHGTPVGGKDE
jgi:hypothetical protein